MKAVFFVALLALGPVLGQHTPVVLPRPAALASTTVEPDPGPISRATTPAAGQWAWLCGGRT